MRQTRLDKCSSKQGAFLVNTWIPKHKSCALKLIILSFSLNTTSEISVWVSMDVLLHDASVSKYNPVSIFCHLRQHLSLKSKEKLKVKHSFYHTLINLKTTGLE